MDKTGPKDEALIQSLAKGTAKEQSAAFKVLFQRHEARVMGYCLRLTGQRPGAEDVAQEVWMRIIQKAELYRPGGSATGWIMTLTRHTALNWLRSQRGSRSVELDSAVQDHPQLFSVASFEDEILAHQDRNELFRAFDALPEPQRLSLSLWLTENLSYAEIAEQLEITESSVKSLLFRARQNLSKALGRSV